MNKIIKRIMVCIFCCILASTILIGCDSSQNTDKEQANNKQGTTASKTNDGSSKKSVDNTKEEKKTNDNAKALIKNIELKHKDTSIDGIKQNLLGELGQGETLQDVSVKDREINLKINLGNETNGLSMEDLAYTRYSSITDYLLDTGKFDVITADFINVGKISMNVSEANSQNVSGQEKKYFPLELITKEFQKY